jgi:23S rRNA (uridine2552-2'-O)-methyltransferase
LYVAQKIGARGKLFAIDLSPLNVALPPQATFLQGDAFAVGDALKENAPYDVVLSDMAPKTTGNRFGDQARSFDLFMEALRVAAALTRAGGAFVGKIFMGEDLPIARTELRKHFAEERLIRPEGTRSVSYEIFLIGLNRRPAGAYLPPEESKG